MRPGRLLEIGCGSGALLFDLCRLGFVCQGLDSSPGAVGIARHILASTSAADVKTEPGPDWQGSFEYLIACEVLEHVEDDLGALRSWLEWVTPGGFVVLSVPAHMSMWSASDVWAGHLRRYDRAGIENLARKANLRVLRTECCGFPLANITHRLRNLALRKKTGPADAERALNTAKSGVDRAMVSKYYALQSSWVGRAIIKSSCLMQRCFLDTSLGDCYVLFAQKEPISGVS
jgi:SAM-dependent methyltransferase